MRILAVAAAGLMPLSLSQWAALACGAGGGLSVKRVASFDLTAPTHQHRLDTIAGRSRCAILILNRAGFPEAPILEKMEP
jgi:hypothetical protein